MNNPHIALFDRFLHNLLRILEKIERHSDDQKSILRARLANDMFPLVTQAEIAAGFSLRACCPIAGVPVESFVPNQKSFANLKAQINQTLAYLQALDDHIYPLDGWIEDDAGPVKVRLPASEFLSQFAIPNFLFHISMVYAIARANGVPVSKGDYDGLHQYPAGFSFESSE